MESGREGTNLQRRADSTALRIDVIELLAGHCKEADLVIRLKSRGEGDVIGGSRTWKQAVATNYGYHGEMRYFFSVASSCVLQGRIPMSTHGPESSLHMRLNVLTNELTMHQDRSHIFKRICIMAHTKTFRGHIGLCLRRRLELRHTSGNVPQAGIVTEQTQILQ